MRWVYIVLVGLFGLIVVLLAVQNLEIVTVSFLGFSLTAPLAVVILVAYVLGMGTGTGLFALIKRSISKARATDPGRV